MFGDIRTRMDIPPVRPKRLSICGALSALFALFTLLAVLSLSYLFGVGVAEAAGLNGHMPSWLHPYAEACSRPAHLAAIVPVVQIPARFGIDLGYNCSGGPDTTR